MASATQKAEVKENGREKEKRAFFGVMLKGWKLPPLRDRRLERIESLWP